MERVPSRLLIGWYALLCAAVVIRTWLWRRHRRQRPRPEQAARLGRIVTIGSGSSGLLWGAAGALFFVPGSPIHEIVLAFVLGGMGAGAAVALAAHLPAFLAYLVPSVLPFAASARHRGRCRASCDGGNGADVRRLPLLLLGWRTHASWARTIALRFANADLARVAAIVDSSFDAIISMTPDLKDHELERRRQHMYGYAAHEVSGRSIEIIVPPDRLAEFRTVYERLRQGENVEPFDTERITKDGRRLQVALRLSPIKDQRAR